MLRHMQHTLESYKVFPYVAWTLVVGFALFTYSLTRQLEQNFETFDTNLADIETRLQNLEQRVGTDAPPAQP